MAPPDLSDAKRALLERRLRGEPRGESIPRRSAGDGPLPLSFAQERLWFLDQLAPGNAFYNVACVLRIEAWLDAAALERSLDALVARHEALRTTFPAVGGRPVQVVAPALEVPLRIHDLRDIGGSEREAEAQRLSREEAQRPFDLAHGPLVRCTLVRLAAADQLLLVTMHHIVSDGWSMGQVFLRELGVYYAAYAAGREPQLPPLPIQYADFAVWQRAWLQGDVLERQLSYWREQLDGAPVLDLPTDRSRPPFATFRGADAPLVLPAELSGRLRTLGEGEGCTLFMTLLAGFSVLLARYSGKHDVVVGAPVAGRTRPETEGLIGFFVNSLVLRTDLSGDPTFRQLLGRTRDVALDAYANQDVPFELLVEELQPERDASRNPLFQVTLQLFSAPASGGAAASTSGEAWREIERGTAMFDLAVILGDAPGGVAGRIEYSTDLFDAATVRRMSGHFERLLESAVADPDRPLSSLPMLGDDERRRLLLDWNATEVAYPRDACAHRLVEAQVARTPDAVAVELGDDRLTYRQLDRRANALAHRLREHGVGRGALVGVCLERSLDLPAALLAVHKAGGAFVPLDPGYPRERLAWMLEDARPVALLTARQLMAALPGELPPVVLLNGDERDDPSAVAVGAADLAYLIYTSGSTGWPKGVMVPHRALANHLLWMQDALPLEGRDAVLQRTPLSFDASIWELFAPLVAGARLVLVPPGPHAGTTGLAELVARHRITVLQLVPSLARMFLREPGVLRCTTLRRIFCGGEELDVDLQDALLAAFGAELINLYGPTEACIDATWWRCEPGGDRVPIGHPIANVRAHVVDPAGDLVPVGVPGELWLAGAGMADGYRDRAAATTERFVADPFGGGRAYRTGDRVRRRPDGALEFLGRLDDQVKLRGHRIEPGEIEAALRDETGVREVAVIVREDEPGDRRLVAYVDGTEAMAGLRRRLAARLPEHMVPATFVAVDALPRTPSGKLDRRALPAPGGGRPTLAGGYVAPRTPAEETMASLWADVLGLERVGADDNFFTQLGGHSLLGTQLVSHVREAFGVELPLRALFEHPTVAGLAEALGDMRESAPIRRIERSPEERGLSDVERLSEEEIDALLERLGAQDG
jgi:amino acid adenylation domain-containing protein